jgi:hypothetical protein
MSLVELLLASLTLNVLGMISPPLFDCVALVGAPFWMRAWSPGGNDFPYHLTSRSFGNASPNITL